MTAQQAIQEARRRGITLTPAGTKLRYRGPEGSLGDELKKALKENKPEILALLGKTRLTHPCIRCDRFAFPEAGTCCYWCREVPREA